jgi:hypothetical protein
MDNKYTYLRGLLIGLVFSLVVVITLVVPIVPMVLAPAYIVYGAVQWFKQRRDYALGLLTVVFAFIAVTLVIGLIWGIFFKH